MLTVEAWRSPVAGQLFGSLVVVAAFCWIAVSISPVAAQPATDNVERRWELVARIEGVAAIVGGRGPSANTQIVLRSDVELLARLETVSSAVETSDTLGTRSPMPVVTDALRARVLEQLIGELVIAQEAERLRAEGPTDAEVEERRREIVDSVGGEQALRTVLEAEGATLDEIEVIARRRALLVAFVRAAGIDRSSVSEGQVEAAYASGEHPFAHLSWERARGPLRVWLEQVAARRDVRRWVEVLRRRTSVEIIARYDTDAESQ